MVESLRTTDRILPSFKCPHCGVANVVGDRKCAKCGVVFGKIDWMGTHPQQDKLLA